MQIIPPSPRVGTTPDILRSKRGSSAGMTVCQTCQTCQTKIQESRDDVSRVTFILTYGYFLHSNL